MGLTWASNKWLGLWARLDAIWHKLTHWSHDVRWRTNRDERCPGDITCETCSCIFWCRLQDDWRE